MSTRFCKKKNNLPRLVEQLHTTEYKHHRKDTISTVFHFLSCSWRVQTPTLWAKWKNHVWSITIGSRKNYESIKLSEWKMTTMVLRKCVELRCDILEFPDESSKRLNRIQIKETETVTHKHIHFNDHITSIPKKQNITPTQTTPQTRELRQIQFVEVAVKYTLHSTMVNSIERSLVGNIF